MPWGSHFESPRSLTKLAGIKQLVGFNKQGELVRYKDVDLYIGGGRLVQLGQNIPDTETMPNVIIQAQGGLVTPAFVDSHSHMFPDELVVKRYEYMEKRFQKEPQ